LALPVPFLLGLLVLFGCREFFDPVPGAANGNRWLLLLLPLPTLLVLVGRQRLAARLVAGRRLRLPPRWWLRAAAGAVPAVLCVCCVQGGWLEQVDRWSGDSHLLDMLLLLTPLLVSELPRVVTATLVGLWCEIDDEVGGAHVVPRAFLPGLRESWQIVRLQLGWPLLLTVPCLALGLLLDVVATDRAWGAFAIGTTPGSLAATFVLLLAAAVVMPWCFRLAFGTVRTLPEPLGTELRRTAAALGFPPARVLQLPTGMRTLNAMMVGPLPVARCLCLTDGLLRSLDTAALTGVVAHEVGHARKGHPGLLMLLAVVVPMLLSGPLQLLEPASLDATNQALVVVVALAFAWTIVRGLAHRFEHEADAASVQALGAEPVTRALVVVSRLALPTRRGLLARVLSLHPEESLRCSVMRRYETDAAFRTRFDARGRTLRVAVFAAVGVAIVGAAVAGRIEWPYEHALWRFRAGDVKAARQLVAAIPMPVPTRWQQTWRELGEELAAAAELAPDAETWDDAQQRFAAGWPRGVEVLLRDGPAAARPWLALALAADDEPPLVRRAIHEFCRAAAAAEPVRVEQAKLVVQRLGVPAGLEPVFGE
jgi:Zn-dependent protease with chaperone function